MEIIGSTFEVLGSVFVAFAALRVHHRVLNEHSIDEQVFRVMKREQVVGITGVILIVLGYSIDTYLFFGGF